MFNNIYNLFVIYNTGQSEIKHLLEIMHYGLFQYFKIHFIDSSFNPGQLDYMIGWCSVGSTQNVFTTMLHKSEEMIRSYTYLLPSTRPIHTVNV